MTQACPKCGSSNTYEIGRDYGCRMCGKQFPKEGSTPIIISKERKIDMPEEIKKYPSGKKGICVNCRREVWISNKEGQCTLCRDAVVGMDPGSAAYAAGLATVKDRINKTGFKTRKAKQFRPIRISKAKFKSNAIPKLKEIKSTLDMTIKEVANTGIPGIIQRARNEQAAYLLEADKLGKAIKILESL